MTILLFHEFGHYFAARRHITLATLPYFIPAPPIPPLVIGTFGAFIKMKSPIMTRSALIDIGASGPIAGFLVSVVAHCRTDALSELFRLIRSREVFPRRFPVVHLLSRVIIGPLAPNTDILLHPVAFAGGSVSS